jgi:arabinan endo-1,5-alpha-L-arabinosidase
MSDFRMLARALPACLAIALSSCASIPGPERSYQNPVIDRDFPDPAVLRAPHGWFYVYATQGEDAGRMLNIQVARSRDLVRWERLGDALAAKPQWGASKQHFWAPHVIYDAAGKTYYMYYSAEPDSSGGKCLAVATSSAPEGPFVDSGRPLLCGEGIEHIDPMAFDDPQTGKHLLYWGSGSLPIKVQELAPDRLRFLPGSTPRGIVFPDPAAQYRSLIEGAWITFRQGTYFLYYSGDRCCTKEPRYAVMVARSDNAMGPFETLSAPILERGAHWLAPGHNSVVADDAGEDWMLYHAFRAESAAGRARVMLLDRIEYRDGWPRVTGGEPSSSPRAAPAIASFARPG